MITPTDSHKICKICGVEKPLTDFFISRITGYICSYCKPCNTKKSVDLLARQRSENPSAFLDRQWKNRLRREFGITADDYYKLYESQGRVCAICGLDQLPHLYVDHDHRDGFVRGLLCRLCNASLGGFKDSELMLLRAADYLAKANCRPSRTDLKALC